MTVDHDAKATTRSGGPGAGSPWYAGAAAHGATWALAFLILRVFAVSGYNWETAFAVSTTLAVDDGVSLIFGSLMAGHVLVAVLLICVLPLLVAAYIWGPRERRPLVLLAGSLGLVALVALTMSFSTWWLPVATLAVFGALVLVRRMPRQWSVRRAAMAVMVRAGAVAAGGVLVVAAFIQTPWVPLERIETTSGTINAYVLNVDSGYLNVLTDDRQYVILLSSDVLSRR